MPPPAADEQPNPPFPGADGYWVERAHFAGLKSFGTYKCVGKKCSGRWSSAHATKDYEQGCRRCERLAFPHLMWVNNASGAVPEGAQESRRREGGARSGALPGVRRRGMHGRFGERVCGV